MRSTIAILLVLLTACNKGENAGAEEARKQAEKEQKEKESHGGVAKKINPPVPGKAHIPCAQLIDADKLGQALGEKEPVTLQESKTEPDAAASCSAIRGGKHVSPAEQAALKKKSGKLGVLPGDELCNISTFCWTMEDPERFRTKCHEAKELDDNTLGFYACVLIVATGEDDVKRFRFFDDDTKCIFQVRAGPSMVDNDFIGRCAKAAHDLIGPEQIAVDRNSAAAPRGPGGAAPAAGSGSGS